MSRGRRWGATGGVEKGVDVAQRLVFASVRNPGTATRALGTNLVDYHTGTKEGEGGWKRKSSQTGRIKMQGFAAEYGVSGTDTWHAEAPVS